jgi:isocitrate/isopropylmalate dehydrogenase
MSGNEVAVQTALFTEKGCERIMRFSFDLARTRALSTYAPPQGRDSVKASSPPAVVLGLSAP